MLRAVFRVELDDLLPGIEQKIGSKILGLRGSIDLLFTDVVFEVKTDIAREREVGKIELVKYFQALLEASPTSRPVGLLTDAVRFEAYIPVIQGNLVKTVRMTSELDLSSEGEEKAVLWLDSFIFSSKSLRPTAKDLRARFGPTGPTYPVLIDGLLTLWRTASQEEENALKLELWSKNLEIVYGSKPETLSFVEQTYLVTLVKLILFLRLRRSRIISKQDIESALTGEFFSNYGLVNLIEEDFFSWISHPSVSDQATHLFHKMSQGLLRYDLSALDEDFFKEIFQEIVERADRHRTGEYYTPEWASELTLEQVGKQIKRRKGFPIRLLDPACGSGTFLTNAIIQARKELREEGVDDSEALSRILQSIIGIDVNPLAVTVAKANYVFALGDLARTGKSFTIPVFVADSVRPAEVLNVNGNKLVEVLDFPVDPDLGNRRETSPHLQLPTMITRNDTLLRRVLQQLRSAASEYRRSLGQRKKTQVKTAERIELRSAATAVFNRGLPSEVQDAEKEVVQTTLTTLYDLVDDGRDSIWVFVLSNVYAPVVLRRNKFDAVVGNPPWIALRFIENKKYQGFVRKEVFEYGLLGKSESHLFTQMEVATLFYCKMADLYLSDGGIIAFVMPRSVLTGASHHSKFRNLRKPLLRLESILDFEGVSPLFNVPSCVLVAVKGQETSYPVIAHRYSGELTDKNLKLIVAKSQLRLEDYQYTPPQGTSDSILSPYYGRLKTGAALYPHAFTFIEFCPHPELGIDLSKPTVRTSETLRRTAHYPWKSLSLTGRIDSDFIFSSLLAGDIVSFGHAPFRPTFVPAVIDGKGYRLIDVPNLRQAGYTATGDWLSQVQQKWEEHASKTSIARFPRFVNSVDYSGLLEKQDSRTRYLLCYVAAGSNLAACVVDRNKVGEFAVDGNSISPKAFVVDKEVWYLPARNEDEVHYLCSVLNSNVMNQAIKSKQTRGAWGPRHIHRRPFEFPVSIFDTESKVHARLADLSKRCHEIVDGLHLIRSGPASRRKKARIAIASELKDIDKLVGDLLDLPH